ncbi:uncharacterized protein LOC110191054 [Drosophila serrata]|uniref:uncharacterized protein LOC110191054 n=1 Tax=Drosophila serrata TaxID=7274 RepID=UPI000A1CFE1B|nr:uncharacterized protein LOC110191054 [Drosophila serrata]
MTADHNAKPKTILNSQHGRNNARRLKLRQSQVVKEQEQVVMQPKQEVDEPVFAPKRSYRPKVLRPSAIRRICSMPARKCNSKDEAKVMYFNHDFGKCSQAVCHEDIFHDTEVCKMHKEKKKPKPKPSIAMRKHLSRIVRKSARNSAIPKSKINRAISKKATKPSPKSSTNEL